MAEFAEVINQYNRMCNSFGNFCTDQCPIEKLGCGVYIRDNPKAAEKVIMDWAKEHKEEKDKEV